MCNCCILPSSAHMQDCLPRLQHRLVLHRRAGGWRSEPAHPAAGGCCCLACGCTSWVLRRGQFFSRVLSSLANRLWTCLLFPDVYQPHTSSLSVLRHAGRALRDQDQGGCWACSVGRQFNLCSTAIALPGWLAVKAYRAAGGFNRVGQRMKMLVGSDAGCEQLRPKHSVPPLPAGQCVRERGNLRAVPGHP